MLTAALTAALYVSIRQRQQQQQQHNIDESAAATQHSESGQLIDFLAFTPLLNSPSCSTWWQVSSYSSHC